MSLRTRATAVLALGVAVAGLQSIAPTAYAAPVVATIAEIQGTDAPTTPLTGQEVSTRGVVTAVYPTGGFNGFYLQTGGTGGTVADATPGASDGIFVYGGTSGFATYPAIGDSVEVTGTAGEFPTSGATLTQVSGNPSSDGATYTALPTALAPVAPIAGPWYTTDVLREAHEGELLAPTGALTVTNSFATGQFGEVGLATGTTPLRQPTEYVDASNTAGIARIVADNTARRLTLDDGKSENFVGAASGTPSSWINATSPVRVGAAATLKGSFVVDQRNGAYKLQPTTPVTGLGTAVAEFTNTRGANQAPAAVGGDIRLATFNVLNYFPTTGVEYVASGGICSYFNDRAGDPVTNNTCSDNGPRGAAETPDLLRQQAKIVTAINRLDASVVSLEEIENSVQFGKDRDDALGKLVDALNADAGVATWAFVPAPADRPTPAEEDVIRTAFIYKPAAVTPVGASAILRDEVNFANAREPLAQAFKAVGAADSTAFGVVVNHLKSKSSSGATGDNVDTGQGSFNADRVRQARAVSTFAASFATSRSIKAMFLVGDFNSYSEEDPIQELRSAGYNSVESTTDPTEKTYSFSGLSGSIDHVLANGPARAMVTGADIWGINAEEAVAYQYSRFNYNVTNFYGANPFGSSDHNPEVVGLDLTPSADVKVNLLNINDFHGRIDTNTTAFATTIERLRQQEGDASTLFLSAGDNIGASLFASALQDDSPAIDVLNALGLRASAVGNHEFDKGFDDLQGRVNAESAFSYLGANVYVKGTTTPALASYRTFTVNGIRVGVVGAVTQETPSLVSPAGIADLDFGDPVAAVNRVAGQLSDGNTANGEADIIVAEYHEGAGQNLADGASCAQEIGAGTTFGRIARDTVAQVDAIFTGHTHKVYACDGPIPGSSLTRPIVQTGSYGENLGQVVLSVDPTTKTVSAYTRRNVARDLDENLSYPRVQQVKTITDAALAEAARVGNTPVGRIGADITTAYAGSSAVRDNRAAESTLGNTVANALRDGVTAFAEPDLGVTNPGGLRAELLVAADTSTNPANTAGVVTFAEANAVLPFNNTVAIVKLTGAQLKQVLEQQYQTNPDGTIPSRPYLALGLSDNVRVTSDPTLAAGSRITSVYIDDVALDPARTYTVSTLSFLATGGDNFRAFTSGTSVDTGLLDAQLWRDFLATGTIAAPISPDYARRQVFTAGAPTALAAGASYQFTLGADLSAPVQPNTGETLDLTSLGAPANTTVEATIGTTSLGSFPIIAGSAAIDLTVPAGASGAVTFVAAPSGTTVTIPIGAATTPPPTPPTTPTPPTVPSVIATEVEIEIAPRKVVVDRTEARVKIQVTGANGKPLTGEVKVKLKGQPNQTVTLKPRGRVTVELERFDEIGKVAVQVVYLGDATHDRSKDTVRFSVVRRR